MKPDVRARIPIIRDLRQIRRRNLPIQQLLPVDLGEPRVREHVARAVREVPEALARVALHELEDEVRRVRVERGPLDARRALRDLLVEHDGRDVRLVERRQPREHLEDEHPQGVPVHALVVPHVADNLTRTRSHARKGKGKGKGRSAGIAGTCVDVAMGRWGSLTSGAR